MSEAATIEAPSQQTTPATPVTPPVANKAPALPIVESTSSAPAKTEDQAWEALTGERADGGGVSEVDKLFDRATGKTVEEPKVEEKIEAKSDKPKEEAKTETDEDTRQRREKVVLAKISLARDGTFTSEDLEAMSTDRLLAAGAKAQKRQTDVDKAYQDLKNLKAGSSTKTPADNSPGRSGAESDVAAGSDDDQSPTSIDQHLGVVKEYDPVVADKLQRATRAFERKVTTDADSRVEKANTALFNTRVSYAVDKLADSFPALKTQEGLDKVLRFAGSIDADRSILFDDDPKGFVDLIKQSCWAKFGEDHGQNTRQALITGNAKARNGQPDLSTVQPKPPQLTPSEIEDFKFKAASEAGGDEVRYKTILAKAGIK